MERETPSSFYLAGPMTGIPKFNFPMFDAVTDELREQGYEVSSPAEMDGAKVREAAFASEDGSHEDLPSDFNYATTLARDIYTVLDHVDAVCVLPNWQASRGACTEVYTARRAGKPVFAWDIEERRAIPIDYVVLAQQLAKSLFQEAAQSIRTAAEHAPLATRTTLDARPPGEELPAADVPLAHPGSTEDVLMPSVTRPPLGGFRDEDGVWHDNGDDLAATPEQVEEPPRALGLSHELIDKVLRHIQLFYVDNCEEPERIEMNVPDPPELLFGLPVVYSDAVAPDEFILVGKPRPPLAPDAEADDRPRIELIEEVVKGGEVRVTSETGGQKGSKDERLDLIPIGPLHELARVYAFGASKYSDHNYMLGYDYHLSFAAMLRHVTAWWDGEDFDPETGYSHLAHGAWHCFTLMLFAQQGLGTDDRPGKFLADPDLIRAENA